MQNLLIHRNITAFLQSIIDLSTRGYCFWTSGTIKTLKAESFCEKFNEKYGVLAPRQKRNYNRKLGKANSTLFMYPQTGGDLLDWLLVCTQGTGLVHQEEKLKDHFSGRNTDRIHWRHYEVVSLNDRMTWRLSREAAEDWEKKIVAAARKPAINELELTAAALCNFPMFRGVREQVKVMLHKAYKTRLRHHYADQLTFPSLPIMKRIKAYAASPNTLGKLVDVYKASLATEQQPVY